MDARGIILGAQDAPIKHLAGSLANFAYSLCAVRYSLAAVGRILQESVHLLPGPQRRNRLLIRQLASVPECLRRRRHVFPVELHSETAKRYPTRCTLIQPHDDRRQLIINGEGITVFADPHVAVQWTPTRQDTN